MYGFGKMGSTILGAGAPPSGASARSSRPRPLTILLHPPEYDERHVGGANALALAPRFDGGDGDAQLYTGGRDGTVRAWDVSEKSNKGGGSACVATMEGHSNWVNALATVGDSREGAPARALLSGSADGTVKCWALDGREGSARDRCVSRVERHEDYVTRLATPDNKAASGGSSGAGPRAYSNKFASAGLGADQVFLWDIDAVARPETTLRRDDSSSSGYSAGRLTPRVLQGQASSAYALAMDASGHAVATGCATGLVRVWDARENRRARALEGHAGAVRCVSVDPTGRLCVSGSSDGTIKLWDLGQRRCVQTLAGAHAGTSARCLAMDETWHRCVSGGADGRVYLTDLGSRRSVLLFEEAEAMVEVLLYQERDGSEKVWTATMGADVRRWSAEAPQDEYHRKTKDDHRRARRDHRGERTRADVINGAPGTWFASARKPPQDPPKDPSSSDGALRKPPGPTPYRSAPEMVLAGSAPVTEHRQLADRRRILARDAAGGLAVWDVPSFSRVATYPPAPPELIERVAAELNGATPVSVPSWFQANARSGSLAVTLTPSSAFQAEAYAVDMGLRLASDELKVNLGVQVVHALLRDWARRRRRAIEARSEGKSAREGDGDSDGGDSDDDGDGGVGGGGNSAEKDAAKKVDLAGLSPCDDAGVFPTPSRKPLMLFEQPGRPAGAPTVLMPTACLRGTDEEEDALPEWIVDVSAGTYRVPDAPKTSFYLVPSEDDPGLPKLSQGKVTAPRVLGVAKVCKYVASKLELEDAEGREAVDLVEMRCAGETLDPGMSVATVRERVWKTPGEDVQLVYRLKPGVRLKKQG